MTQPPAPRGRRVARAATFTALSCLIAVGSAGAATDPGTVSDRLGSTQSKERALRSQVQADQSHVRGFQGRIDELRSRLAGLEGTLASDRARLGELQGQLRDARSELVRLRAEVAHNTRVLEAELVALYKTPRTDLVSVVLDARGFDDLLGRVDSLDRVARHNADTARRVKSSRAAAAVQTKRLAGLEADQAAQTQKAETQRDAVAHLKLQVVDQQLAYVRARNHKSKRLKAIRGHRLKLQHELDKIQRQQARAAGVPRSGGTSVGGSGFFPAAGTNYSQGDEPQIAARLEKMAKALHLHLIGLSGYRSPQHSMEVGGFANDPHTKGQASDTPGLEGVSESTLNRFGLTRPFAGAAEADHVQLSG